MNEDHKSARSRKLPRASHEIENGSLNLFPGSKPDPESLESRRPTRVPKVREVVTPESQRADLYLWLCCEG